MVIFKNFLNKSKKELYWIIVLQQYNKTYR